MGRRPTKRFGGDGRAASNETSIGARAGRSQAHNSVDRSLALVELAGLIFEAAVDPACWPAALNRLADATGSTYSSVGTSNFTTGKFTVVAPRHDPEYLRRYVEEGWMNHNIHWQRSGAMPIGQVFSPETFVPRDEFVRTPFYHEWAAPQGHENALGVNVLVEGANSTVASTTRPFSRGAYSSEDERLFAILVPHIQRAVQLQHRLAMLEMHRASSTAGFDRLRDGVLIVQDDLRIVFANRTAEELLSEGDGLRRDADGLAGGTPTETARLRRLIVRNDNGMLDAGGRCRLTRGEGRAALSALVVPLRNEAAWSVLPHCRAAIVFLTDPDRDGRARTETLRTEFGLTRAEATFLVEIIKGDGLQASADRLGVSLTTARTHLRHVFDKTGTRRQAELVGLVASLRAALRDEG